MATDTSSRNTSRIERVVRKGLRRSGVRLTEDQIGFVSDAVVEVYHDWEHEAAREGITGVTAARITVLRLVANGYTNDEIAKATNTSRAAVQSQIRRTADALGARGRTHAVALGFKFGLLTVEDLAKPRATRTVDLNRLGEQFHTDADAARSDAVRTALNQKLGREKMADVAMARAVAQVEPSVPLSAILRVVRAMRIVVSSRRLREES